ncbi:MAG: hypothetical protein L0I24_23765, partial [Pseudonocardia sp.]|nr:hypothetical protein [Pseudonocardia sp.]
MSTVLVGIGLGGGSAAGIESAPVTLAAPQEALQPQRVVAESQQATPEAAPAREPEPTRDAAPEPTRAAVPETSAAPTAERTAAPAVSIPVRAAAQPQLVPGTPCTTTAKACVDLAARKAWLIQDG